MSAAHSSGAPGLAHRTVSSIRTGTAKTGVNHGRPGPPSPLTPSRSAASAFASPSSVRADEDVIVIELGSRFVRAGFAGDALPKAVESFGPDQSRRIGDHRPWLNQGAVDKRSEDDTESWAQKYELWNHDTRNLELGLVEDKLERVLRDIFTHYLLVDSRPRKITLALPSGLPLPLLSAILGVLFARLQAPQVSLFSSAVMTTVAAGVRSSLVIDMGWAETTVTSVYEYREVRTSRCVRGAKRLVRELHKLLRDLMAETSGGTVQPPSLGECEDICCRLMWCRPSSVQSANSWSTSLPTVQEQAELDAASIAADKRPGMAFISFQSPGTAQGVWVPLDSLADLCEQSFLDLSRALASFDSHEIPVHQLVYSHLLSLPLDARAVCMSRMVFTGGCSNIPGLKSRILDEIAEIVRDRGWNPVSGKAVRRQKIQRTAHPSDIGSETVVLGSTDLEGQDDVWHDAPSVPPKEDPTEEQLEKGKVNLGASGVLRCISSLGPWTGASLVCQLKVPAISQVDRDVWFLSGINGASRSSDVDVRTQQRHSLGPGGLMRAASTAHQASWTLGAWGHH